MSETTITQHGDGPMIREDGEHVLTDHADYELAEDVMRSARVYARATGSVGCTYIDKGIRAEWKRPTPSGVTAEAAALAETFRAVTPDSFSHPLHTVGQKRVALVAASLIDLYRGKRYAMQVQAEPGAHWNTVAIIHSPETAAEWVALPMDDEDTRVAEGRA